MGAEEERCFNLGLTTGGLNERAAVVGHWAVILKYDRVTCSVSKREPSWKTGTYCRSSP